MTLPPRAAPAFLCLVPSLLGAADGDWHGPKPPESPAKGCARIADAGVSGTFVLFDPQARTLRTCHPARAAQRFLPASTFKIPNALNALENRIVRDEHEVFRWDGVERLVEAWNQDTDLASGMRNSTVWFCQEIARRTGPRRLQSFVDTLDYGNRDIGGGIDRFWLDGGIRISAYEQVAFLDRLRRRALPLSARSQRIVARILERGRGAGWVLRAKTGAALKVSAIDVAQGDDGRADNTGWYVGWVDRGDKAYVFALNITLRDTEDLPRRESLAKTLLADNGGFDEIAREMK
jgi:beta-lactamase class D